MVLLRGWMVYQRFEPEKKSIYFCGANRERLTGCWAGPQGTFRIIHDARTGTEKITQESSSANFDQRTRQFHADGIRGMPLPAFREKLRQALEHDAAVEH